MVQVRVLRELTSDDRARIERFLAASALDDGGPTLNDHLRADLGLGPRAGFVAATATTPETEELLGYAQASAGNTGFVVGAVVDPDARGSSDDHLVQLLRTVLGELPADADVTWWAHDAPHADVQAARLGLRPGRCLLQMRRSLPLDDRTAVEVRPFVVGSDEAAWLEANNAAFQWHAEQGGWDLATLQQREHEPWFDPAGFLLHERDGRLAAFCWTKVHPGTPVVGEIYVIAVHPDFHGLGLGRSLTIAGLRSLHASGATEGMLYVDADNTAAVRLYESLGFDTAHTDQAYVREGTTT